MLVNSETTGAIHAIADAERSGQVSTVVAEHLIGFVVGQALDFEPPSRSTWYRRCRELTELGIEPPATPATLPEEPSFRSSANDRRVSDRRRGERRGGDRREAA